MNTPIESTAVANATPAPKHHHNGVPLTRNKDGTRRNHRKAKRLYDRRFAIGRRIKQLAASYCERLNVGVDPDPLLLASVERCAELTALAEVARARALRGDPDIAYDDIVRLSRLAAHALRHLQLDRNTAKQQPTLSDYLRARNGEQP
jgi:hypothetical protein